MSVQVMLPLYALGSASQSMLRDADDAVTCFATRTTTA